MWWLFACGPPRPPPSIVLVTLDTTRADRIGAYGYPEAYTPNIDALAHKGVRFDNAYTTVPLTSAAHASLLSGLYPAHTGVHGNGDATLPDEVATLAERLGLAGYKTAASVGAFVTTRLWNFDQGFELYYDRISPLEPNQRGSQRAASQVVSDIARNIDLLRTDAPVFLWIHLYDPHLPWVAPGIWQDKGADDYDSEIAFADSQIGSIKGTLERALGERIIWVVVGDHGEGLASDFEQGHGLFLRRETARVPLVIRPAEPLREPLVVDEVVSVTDIAPTLLSLAGIAPNSLDGFDLSAALAGEEIDRPPVVVESEAPKARFGWAPEVVVIDESWKLYDSPGGPQLYALSDAAEAEDRARSQPADVARLQAVAREVRGGRSVGRSLDLGGISAQLEALGYTTVDVQTEISHTDAKTRIDTIRRLDEAREAREGRLPGVDPVEIWKELLAEDPDLIEARLSLVLMAERRGDRALALSLLDEGIARTPEIIALRLDRSRLLLSLDRSEEAKADAEAILAHDPENRSARDLWLSTIEPARALETIYAWQKTAPDDAFLHARAGQALLTLGKLEEAHSELLLALNTEMPWVGVHRALAFLEAKRGRMHESLEHLEREVELFPDSLRAWVEIGQTSLAYGDIPAARDAFQRAFALSPADRDARLGLAEATLRSGDLPSAEQLLAPLIPSEDRRVLVVYGNLLKAKGDPKGDALLSKLLERR